MRKRYLWPGVILALMAVSLGYIGIGTQIYEQYHLAYANYQFAPTSQCGALIAWSPPQTIYMGIYVNQPSLVTIRYRSPTPQTLHITLGIPHFTEDQGITVQAASAFQMQSFKPPLLDEQALDALTGPDQRQAQLHLRVQSGSSAICDSTTSVLLKSRLWMHWGDITTGGNAAYLAGWVTPEAPTIADLIGHAAQWLEAHPGRYSGTSALYGYNAGQATEQDVRNQVDAIFDTLQSVYRMHYAQDNVPYNRDQRIQLPEDILRTSAPTGMCVETTAILASAIERLGMRPYIILVPGHAFLGVALGADQSAPIEYWETSDLNGGISGNQANLNGNTEYTVNQQASKILRVIDVGYERQQGIEPIE